jgi:N-formylglutamate amidohydrolase
MDKKIILHIPHSSTNIPHKEGYVVQDYKLEQEILKLTDWYTDDLFYSNDDEMIIAQFSRIFCDPERFTDDSQEVMSQFGMGVLYEKSDNGDKIRNVSPELKNKVLLEFYEKHHKKFSDAVNNQLNLFGKAMIIDCHSYPNIPLKRDLDQSSNRPDFNIGTDSYHTPKKLIDLSISFFEEAGYSLGIDKPYRGSIVPMEHYQKNKNVQTIMLEINRKLYINEPTNIKNERYFEIKKVTEDFIKTIKNSL